MTSKPVVPRGRARFDLDEIVARYAEIAGETVALVFVDDVEAAYRYVASHAASGSPRYAHGQGLPGSPCWRLKPFPHLVFYVERDDRIDGWRVLQSHRDSPAWMGEPGGEDTS